MCTAVNFSNRLLFAVFLRLILSFKMTPSKEMPPNTDPIGYKEDPTASNAVASDFKIKFTPRNREVIESFLKNCHEGLTEFVTGDNAEPLSL